MTSFSITATPENEVAVGEDGVRRVVFSVANETGRAIMARAELQPSTATIEDWLSIEGDKERTFERPGTHTFKVAVTPPEGAAPGRYTFRLRVVATNEPSDDLETFSEPIAFEITPPPRKVIVVPQTETPPPTDWWRILAIALGALAIVALLAIGILVVFDGDDDGSPTPSVTVSPGVTSSPAATPTVGPTDTVPPSVVVTEEPTAEVCAPRSVPGMLVFDCLPGGGMSTQVIAVPPRGYVPVPGVQLYFSPEDEQDDCAVNGGLAILAPGDPGTNFSFPVLTPAHQFDPRQCNDYALDIRFDSGATSMTIEVPRVDEEYGATVWDQTGQIQVAGPFQGRSTAGTDGLIAFRFSSTQRFYFVYLYRLPDGAPLYVRSIRYTQ